MKRKDFLTYFSGLVVLGVLAFALLGYGVEYRQNQHTKLEPISQTSEGMEQLLAATITSFRRSADALNNSQRADAMHTLNSSARSIEVGRSARSTSTQLAFELAHRGLSEARHATQNGRYQEAIPILRTTADELERQNIAEVPQKRIPDVATWPEYNGAVLTNAAGVKVGEVKRIGVTESGTPTAYVVIGGAQDILGFIDYGGTAVQASARQLLYGHPKTIGADLVAAPTLAIDTEAVIQYLSEE